MTWSAKQQRLSVIAANRARWNDQQRYMAMRFVGCPVDKAKDRPSVKHPRNDNDHFRLYMALAESHAGMHSVGEFPQPGRGQTWQQVAADRAAPMRRMVEAIAAEAVRRIPDIYSPDFLAGFIDRMTRNDPDEFAGCTGRPTCPAECEEGQLYRVLEGLKAWVGRAMLKRDMRPESFTISEAARRRFFDQASGGGTGATNRKGRAA